MKPPVNAPYGSWKSPITSDSIVSDSVKFGGISEKEGVIYFSEMRPFEKGRSVLVRFTDTGFEDLLPPPYNARTRVHEYGGGASLMAEGAIYFSNDADQQIYRRDPSGEIHPLTHEKNTRFADGSYDPSRDLLFYVVEVHGEKIENCLSSVDAKTGQIKRVAEGWDFYSSPRVSPDGRFLAYFCWNHPNMPWDGNELHVAEIRPDGSLAQERVVAGGKEESINEPMWGPDGGLYFISDRSGWWNLYRENKGEIDPLCPMDAEFSSPQWVFGLSSYVFWGKDKIICTYSKQGLDYLAVLPAHGGKLLPISLPFNSIGQLSIAGDRLYFIGGSTETPPCLVQYDLKRRESKILKKSRNLQIDPSYFSIPKLIEFPTEGGLSGFAFYYPPKNPNFQGLAGELPPLLVHSHGGPTSDSTPLFNLEVQYWTSRGIAVLDVNYGGSSGYGRPYRDRLKGKWGIVDIDDCVKGALYCCDQGLADRQRLGIEGGSAGGYTTLAALAFRNTFRVGASYYGVSDLEALVLHTHKFESRYLDQLIGKYPSEKKIYRERSPIHHVDRIDCPIILLQGEEDAIVPPSQSEKMYESLLKRGIPTAYLLFEKEQHGFRQAANIQRSIEATAYFYSKILGFSLADLVQPVKIENLHEK